MTRYGRLATPMCIVLRGDDGYSSIKEMVCISFRMTFFEMPPTCLAVTLDGVVTCNAVSEALHLAYQEDGSRVHERLYGDEESALRVIACEEWWDHEATSLQVFVPKKNCSQPSQKLARR